MKNNLDRINKLRNKLQSRKTMIQLTTLQIAIIKSLKGYKIPMHIATESDGAVGRHIEELLKSLGLPIDQMAICDFPTGEEVKSRKTGSKANHTVGSMTLDDILKTSYRQSSIKKKLTHQIRFSWSDTYYEITDVTSVDMRDRSVQGILESRYEASRSALDQFVSQAKSNNVKPNFTPHQKFGDFECKDGNCFAFRLPDTIMKKIINISQTSSSRDAIFDIR